MSENAADESAHLLPRDVIVTSREQQHDGDDDLGQASCMRATAGDAGAVKSHEMSSSPPMQTTDDGRRLHGPPRGTRRSLSNGVRRLSSDDDDDVAVLLGRRSVTTTGSYGTLHPAPGHRQKRDSLQRLRQLSFTEVHSTDARRSVHRDLRRRPL